MILLVRGDNKERLRYGLQTFCCDCGRNTRFCLACRSICFICTNARTCIQTKDVACWHTWTLASRQTRLKTMMGGMLTEFTFYCQTSLLVCSCLQVCSSACTKHRSAYNLHCVFYFWPFRVKVCRYLRAELSKMPVVVIQPAGYLHCVLSLALSSLSHFCIFAILLPSVLYLAHMRSVPVDARA